MFLFTNISKQLAQNNYQIRQEFERSSVKTVQLSKENQLKMSIEKKNCLSGIDKRRNRNGFFSSEEIVASLGDKAEMKGGFCIALGYLAFIRITGTAPQNGEVLTTFWPHRMGKF